jgi:hypothetical protein
LVERKNIESITNAASEQAFYIQVKDTDTAVDYSYMKG